MQLNKTAEVTFSPVYDKYTEDYDWYNFDYYYMFTPDETGTYEFEVTSSNPYKEYYFIDEKGSVCADDYYPVFAKKLEAGNNYYIKITDGVEDDSVWYKVTARKHSHSYSVESLDKADFEYNGWINKECKTCGDATSSSIPYVKSATVSATSFTRTGKQIIPGVTVKDSTGKTLKNGVDYLLSGSLFAIDVGTYSLTVKLTGNYAGSKNLSYKILPKGTTVASLTAIGNGFSVRINEQNVQTTGYQIQYSENSNFSYAKIITAKDFSNLTRKVTDLKADVKYYVRVRTYKDAGGKYYYSSWSAVKAVKTLYNASIKLNYSACKLAESQKLSLKATAVPSNLNITWKSSDPSVLKVDSNGKISGIKKGTATVTASIIYNKKAYSANCKVTVKSPAVVLNKNTLSIKNGYYSFLKATTFPSKQTVNWNSSNTSVATVSTAGKVIGKKVGSCVITASFTYGGKNFKASCKVTIKKYTPTKGEQQALRMAKSYVENYDYSEAGLIESLKYEGFTKKGSGLRCNKLRCKLEKQGI
ncbi:MAG: Ig-like domain-containing protein [Clostridia bacterium]|nr:Ig-like domain-containing protein [Clostridia bacterium]